MEHLHQPGDIINQRYRILEILGKGGISITYKAVDEQIEQPVAIKALSLRQTQDWKIIELFEREARVLQNLNHPAIPNYLDYFQIDTAEDRYFYIVQEVASGQSLAEWIKQGWRPNETEVRNIAQQILDILIYLHQFNPPVIHRDIKPQNIIRQSDGQVFLVDFGAVKDTYRQTMTAGSTVVGTYGYMAPEQFRGQAKPATDLYGLAATLLFLLTHTSPADLPEKRLKIDFRPAVDISSDFADWLERMLEPATDDRFETAKEALAVLQGKREIIHPLTSSNRQPAGSKIKLQKTANKLVVDMSKFTGLFDTIMEWILVFFVGLYLLFMLLGTAYFIEIGFFYMGFLLLSAIGVMTF
jgi:serine/threonine protein kinase